MIFSCEPIFCRRCLESRDPYCAWHNGNCISVNIEKRRDQTRTRKSPKQDILQQKSNLSLPCLDSEVGAKELYSEMFGCFVYLLIV